MGVFSLPNLNRQIVRNVWVDMVLYMNLGVAGTESLRMSAVYT
jgi:hypothetical protein